MAAFTGCSLTTGYTLGCRGISGIQAVWIAPWTLTPIDSTYDASGSINAFTIAASASFLKFEQDLEQGSLTEAGNFNAQTGTAYYDQIVEITIFNTNDTGDNQTLANQVATLGRSRWRILVLDTNGVYYLVGKQNPVMVTAVAGGPGKTYADVNGYTITFTGKEYDAMQTVTSAAAVNIQIP